MGEIDDIVICFAIQSLPNNIAQLVQICTDCFAVLLVIELLFSK